jgi:hypothetical protein
MKKIVILFMIFFTLLFLFNSLISPSFAANMSWKIQIIDSGYMGGNSESLVLDSQDNPHMSYLKDGNLMYASWNGKTWNIQTVETAGACSLALDSNGNPHISYSSGSRLKYASWTGSSWSIETVEEKKGYVYYISLALDHLGNPHISYEVGGSADGGNLKYAYRAGLSWTIQIVDDDYGSGLYNSLALDSSGNPHISYAYYSYSIEELRYASWNGTAWNKQIVVGNAYSGMSSSLVLDSLDNPHISYGERSVYWDDSSTAIKYTSWTGSTWNTQIVDQGKKVQPFNSFALDSAGNPHIVYERAAGLQYARWTGSKWDIQVIDNEQVNLGSFVLDSNGYPHINYCDYTSGSQIKYAFALTISTVFPWSTVGVIVAFVIIIPIAIVVGFRSLKRK